MAWEEVEAAARFEARNMQWSTPDTDPPGLLERVVRKAFHMPSHRTVEHGADSRLVMVVPTAGGIAPTGLEKTYGWAVRLRNGGILEYLRWQAFGSPDWTARFPFEEHQLEPLTPGADHWGPLDAGQRLKTDLDWSPNGAATVAHPEGSNSWSISPALPQGGALRQSGAGLLQALGRLRHDRETQAAAEETTALPTVRERRALPPQ